MKSPLELLSCLIEDLIRLNPCAKGLDRDLKTIEARAEHEGTGFLTVALPTLCAALDKGLASGRFACPTGFSRIRSGALPKLFSGLLCEVFDATGQLKQAPDVSAVKAVREATNLFKKLVPTDEGATKLHQLAEAKFWDTDDSITDGILPSEVGHLLSRVSGYILSQIPSSGFLGGVSPRHGPGAVAERLTANQKWSAVAERLNQRSLPCSEVLEMDLFGADDSPRQSDERSDSQGLHRPDVPLRGSPTEQSAVSSYSECARVVSVPKNSSARRTITIEPVGNMFVQQALNQYLRKNIERCPILSRCLALTDQSKNQVLALEGSRTGNYATLDLSSASDRLSNELVKLIFSRRASLNEAMQECRTSRALNPEGIERDLKKFAGMGNALTFPVQSVVFACIAIAAIVFQVGKRPTYGHVKAIAGRIQVYGDDIIVPTEYAHIVATWLEYCGLKVNHDKSFTTGNFRESCGVDAFKGYDVTPVYVRAMPGILSDSPNAVAHYVSLSNLLWLRGLYKSATKVKEHVEESLSRFLPIVPPDSGALGWHTRHGRAEFHHWNSELQRPEYRALRLVSVKRNDPLGGVGALLKSLLTPLIERDKDHLKKSVIRYKVKMKSSYFPSYNW